MEDVEYPARWMSSWWGALLMDVRVYHKIDIVAYHGIDPSRVSLPQHLAGARFRNKENAHEAIVNLRSMLTYQYEEGFGIVLRETAAHAQLIGPDPDRYLYEVTLVGLFAQPKIILQIKQEEMFVFEDAAKTAMEMEEILEGAPYSV